MPDTYLLEFRRYKGFIDKTLGQIDEVELNRVPVEGGNSIGMIIRHISGNLMSRFTDFLTTDGEKVWRDREGEFQEQHYTLDDTHRMWDEAWTVLERNISSLSRADLQAPITIRQQELTVHAALLRSLAHLSYHVGQLVLLARVARGADWDWITIPRGQSNDYNQNPDLEKGFGN